MRNLTIFLIFVCIFQIVFTKPLDEKLSPTQDDSALIKDEKKLDNMETSENNIVFRPLFVYRQQQAARRRARQHQRCRRHVTSMSENHSPHAPSLSTTEKIVQLKEKTAKKVNDSDLVSHETGLVFRPLFVYRQQQASRRRIQAERRNQAERRYYQSQPSYNHSPHYYKPAKKDCHDHPNKELYI